MLTDDIALAKKATEVVIEVKNVALLASMMVWVILLCTVLRPARREDCLKALMKTRISSTPMPMMTKREMRLRRPTVLIPEREKEEEQRKRERGGEESRRDGSGEGGRGREKGAREVEEREVEREEEEE